MKADGLRMLGWAIPILCMAAAGWILFKENQAFVAADYARNQAHRDNEEKAKELEVYKNLPPEVRYAAVDDVPEEETTFLTFLRTRTTADNVTFKNWFSQTIEYGKDKQAAPKDPKVAELLKGLRKITGALTFTGAYQDIRKLVGELEESNRLYTQNNITWTATKDGTQLAMTISRYVAPAKPGAVKKTPPPKQAGAAPTTPARTGIHPGAAPPATQPVTQPATPKASPGITTKP